MNEWVIKAEPRVCAKSHVVEEAVFKDFKIKLNYVKTSDQEIMEGQKKSERIKIFYYLLIQVKFDFKEIKHKS